MTTHLTIPLEEEEHLPASVPRLSTYWMPLEGIIQHWAAYGAEADRVPVLTATAHAFFALSHESRALRHFTFACEQHTGSRLPDHAGYWYGQAEQALFEATHHWSRAACALDSLSPRELTSVALAEARQMSRAARAQQERLWKLTDEVHAAIATYRVDQQPQRPPAKPTSMERAAERSAR